MPAGATCCTSARTSGLTAVCSPSMKPAADHQPPRARRFEIDGMARRGRSADHRRTAWRGGRASSQPARPCARGCGDHGRRRCSTCPRVGTPRCYFGYPAFLAQVAQSPGKAKQPTPSGGHGPVERYPSRMGVGVREEALVLRSSREKGPRPLLAAKLRLVAGRHTPRSCASASARGRGYARSRSACQHSTRCSTAVLTPRALARTRGCCRHRLIAVQRATLG